MSSSRTILFLAGDASGDLYAARLVGEVHATHPDWTLHALGGTHLAQAMAGTGGAHIGNTSGCSAIGIASAVGLYWRARRLRDALHAFVERHHVDAAVLCDWGGFNCAQLRFFRERGIPVLYYFPPRSWQRTGRAGLQIAPWVDRVATPFRWSADRLRTAGCEADWVGHPLLETKPSAEGRRKVREELGVAPGEKLVALLPGSRVAELRVLGPRLAAAAALLKSAGNVRFVVVTPGEIAGQARRYFPELPLISDRAGEMLLACDAAVVKTGTATLEAAVMGAPQVAVYDAEWIRRIEWLLLWMWKRIPFVAMPNIILQRAAVTELLGLSCRADRIAQEVTVLLGDEAVRRRMLADYARIGRELGADLPLGATRRTAQILEEMLDSSPAGLSTSPAIAR